MPNIIHTKHYCFHDNIKYDIRGLGREVFTKGDWVAFKKVWEPLL